MNQETVTVLVLILFGGSVAHADTIELKTGEKIEGVFKQAGPAGAVIEVGGKPFTFAVDKVKAIYFGQPSLASTVISPDAKTALDAIKGLRSIVKASVAYRDYAPRVLDAKVQVDRFVNSSQGTAKLRYAVKAAMEFYNLASRVWNMKLFTSKDTSEIVALGKTVKGSLIFVSCPGVQARISLLETGSSYPPNDYRTLGDIGRDLADHLDLLWACASIHVAEAEAASSSVD